MTFFESIQTCFRKYGALRGTASRSEYWWFFLFCLLGSSFVSVFSDGLGALFSLATAIPSIAVTTRRLHETDRSGWWQLLWFVPVIGWIVLIVFLAQEPRANRFGTGAEVYV